jgi:tRNA threonylcarbamoyl adenosine modification protein YeaZ
LEEFRVIEEEGLLTLGVDTSTEKRSVALMRGARLLSMRVSELREGGSAGLLLDIDRALESASVGLREIELFAAASGPGSFTGLRSGLATVKGLALTLGRHAVGVPTLHAIAHAARPARRLLALLPAGRGEVFAQLLGVDAGGHVSEYESPGHLSPKRLVERMARLGVGLKWAGGGALKFQELIGEAAKSAGIDFVVSEETGEECADDVWRLWRGEEALAKSVAELARSMYVEASEPSAGGLRAIYVRPSDAELKELCHAQE